jgi:hypothetical protein
MDFHPCSCAAARYVREPRRGWMRLLLPSLRHWSCADCGRHFMASKAAVVAAAAGRTPALHAATGPGTPPFPPSR